jgi:hypothetical protein
VELACSTSVSNSPQATATLLNWGVELQQDETLVVPRLVKMKHDPCTYSSSILVRLNSSSTYTDMNKVDIENFVGQLITGRKLELLGKLTE